MRRNLAIVSLISAALIIAALGVKLSDRPARPGGLSWSLPLRVPLAPDGSFFGKPAEQPSTAKRSQLPAPATPPAQQPTEVSALSYLVGNVATGQILDRKYIDTVLPVASMSKLITAIAATDSMSSTTEVEITEPEAEAPPDGSHLKAGEKFTAHELLYPMLLDSSNIAAEALASSTDRDRFLALMNGYAREIGMNSTNFADPSGVDPRNRSTARDFFALARYIYRYRPDILAITRIVSTSTASTTEHGAHVFASIHPFVTDPRFIGGKTG
ncbi:MAG: D-alanyl-D-alanine carboxypeptidase, partial [Patescibacteria group bacterium]|nr:D-alanyl-D-alanine carboxypeptidase [Patescibacteria group bacterium]